MPGHENDRNINQRIGKIITKKTKFQFNWIKFNFGTHDIVKLYTHHSEAIMVGYDELKQLSELIEYKEQDSIFYVEPAPNDLAKGTAERFIDNLEQTLNRPLILLKNYIYLIITMIVILISIVITIYIMFRNKCFKLRHRIQKKMEKRNRCPCEL